MCMSVLPIHISPLSLSFSHLSMYVYHMHACAHGIQNKVSDPLELELQVI